MDKLDDENLLRKLNLLKSQMSLARECLDKTSDEYYFALGISLLHDAIENLFWCISIFFDISLKEKDSLPRRLETLKNSLETKKLGFNKSNIALVPLWTLSSALIIFFNKENTLNTES